MSRLLVTQYQAEVEKIIRYGGSRKETSIRNAFERLLNDYCKPRNYLLIPELDFKTRFNTTVFPDGTIKDAIRLEHGWWESKDQYDRLDKEIEKKFEQGYPDENILFEDSQTAVLIQHSQEVARVSMKDADALDNLLNFFVDYERPEVRDFRAAILKFRIVYTPNEIVRFMIESNEKTISVIIGNPPYNAHQENFNQRNSNRPYQSIDQAIKNTYIKAGTAQNQIVVYDMYTCFLRWASDRLGDNGLIAFVTNRSFIDSKTFDGFRKCIDREFDYVYIVDTQSDVRNNPKISGTKNNVFGIQTGVAVMFLVRTKKEKTR
jgi:hypothetical protein